MHLLVNVVNIQHQMILSVRVKVKVHCLVAFTDAIEHKFLEFKVKNCANVCVGVCVLSVRANKRHKSIDLGTEFVYQSEVSEVMA